MVHWSILAYTGLVKILKKHHKRTGLLVRAPHLDNLLSQPFCSVEVGSPAVACFALTVQYHMHIFQVPLVIGPLTAQVNGCTIRMCLLQLSRRHLHVFCTALTTTHSSFQSFVCCLAGHIYTWLQLQLHFLHSAISDLCGCGVFPLYAQVQIGTSTDWNPKPMVQTCKGSLVQRRP